MQQAAQKARQADRTGSRPVLLLANQPPMGGPAQERAATLATMLQQGGFEVITAGEGGESYVRHVLEYHTRKRFARSRERLVAAMPAGAGLVVFASGLGTERVDKPLFRPRLSEWVRRYWLARDAARAARRTVFVMDVVNPLRGGFWVALACVLRLAPRANTRLTFRKSPARLFTLLGGGNPPDITAEQAIDGVFMQLVAQGRFSRISLARIRNLPAENKQALEDLSALCTDKTVRAAANFQFFADLPPRDNAALGPDPKRDFANTPAPGDPLPRITRHTRHNLPERPEVAPCKTMSDAQFRRWYIGDPFANSITPPLPLAPDMQRELAQDITGDGAETLATLLRMAARGDGFGDVAPDILAHYAAPVPAPDAILTRMEMVVALLAGYPARTRALAEQPWQSREIQRWFASVICPAFPALHRFSSAPPLPDTPPPSLKIAGIVKGEGGLARNAQMHARTLAALGPDVSLHARSALPRADWHKGSGARGLRRSMILHNINAHRIPDLVLARALHNGENPLHVGYLLWELETIPPAHRLAGDLLDDIWAPSRFIQTTYETAYARPVHMVGKAITLPPVPAADLSHLGILPQHRLFLLVFDVNSSVERKNPLAAVRAFLAAFPDTQDVRLLVKTTPFHSANRGDPTGQIAEIKALSAKDPRIVIEQAYLPFPELLARIKRADCIVSSHRAEGFGYIPAFALKLGRPVIVTDYSGTQDYCTPETAFVVPHGWSAPQFTPVFCEAATPRWAEVDIHEMARRMQQVLADPAEASRRALAGQKLVNRLYAPARLSQTYLQRLRALGVLE